LASWLDDIGYYDDQKNQHLRVMVYGAMGVGKTQFAGTFPKPVFIDTDKGGMTLRRVHAPFVPCYETRGIVKRVFEILKAAETRTAAFAPDGAFADRETIVLDSASVFSNTALSDYIWATGKNPMETKASYDEYGKLLNTQIELGKTLKRLSSQYNIVVTALVDVNKDENTGSMYGGPLLVGGYRQLIGADFDEVYYLATEGSKDSIKHVAYTAKTGIYDAKTRLALPYRLENPSADMLFKALA
jgi:hypothetical protein